MDETIQTQARTQQQPGFLEAWQMVLGQLQTEMSRAMFDTWVQPLRPVSFHDGVFTLGAYNPYARDWVESRLAGRIGRLMEGLYHEPIKLQVTVINGFYDQPLPPAETPLSVPQPVEKKSPESSGSENSCHCAQGNAAACLRQRAGAFDPARAGHVRYVVFLLRMAPIAGTFRFCHHFGSALDVLLEPNDR